MVAGSTQAAWPWRSVITDPWLYAALSLALPTVAISQLWPPDLAGPPWRHWLLLVLVYPVLEELCFRGWVQPMVGERLPQRWGPLTLANVITSVLFAAAHAVYLPFAAATLFFLPSMVFGALRDRHQGVLGATLVHSGYNAAVVLAFS